MENTEAFSRLTRIAEELTVLVEELRCATASPAASGQAKENPIRKDNSASPNPLERYPWLPEKFDVQMRDLVIIDSTTGMYHNIGKMDLRLLQVQYATTRTAEGLKFFALTALERLGLYDCEVLDKDGKVLGMIMMSSRIIPYTCTVPSIFWEFNAEEARFVLLYTPRDSIKQRNSIYLFELKQES